jgi:hypothetical protein
MKGAASVPEKVVRNRVGTSRDGRALTAARNSLESAYLPRRARRSSYPSACFVAQVNLDQYKAPNGWSRQLSRA